MSSSRARTPLVLAVLPLALALAACAEPAATTTPEATATPSATEATASATVTASASPSASAEESEEPSADATVLVADSDFGDILTDADGMTIYFFANDTEGMSNCEGDCLANWPAVEVEGEPVAGDDVDAKLGTFERSDGTVQLTVNGFPAYYFAGDAGAGDTNGQGVGDVWWVFGSNGEPIEG
jgi:predicted lipoprotein with Yx(FWY)xxD motif